MQKTLVRSLGPEDPLEKGMTTHSSILDWRIPWTEEPGELQVHGVLRVGHDLATKQQQQIGNKYSEFDLYMTSIFGSNS